MHSLKVVLGDARLSLANCPDRSFNLIVVDAFGSDAIPTHLITREAVELYRRKLAPGGVLLFHVSNQHYKLAPILGNIAAELGLHALAREHLDVTEAQLRSGLFPSRWVVMYEQPQDIGDLIGDPRWLPLGTDYGAAVWTDDYSDVLGAVKWK